MESRLPQFLQSEKLMSLNGLRAVSIILVIFSHFYSYENNISDLYLGKLALGKFGVTIFFVLSGFLITSLLLKERFNNKIIKLKQFYIRRAFRILPLIFLYLFILSGLNLLFKLGISKYSFINSILLIRNLPFLITNDWYTGHLWSLSVEEQYYLLFPFLLVKFKQEKYLKLIFLILIIMPILFYLNHNSIGIFNHNKLFRGLSWLFIIIISPGTLSILVGSAASIIYYKYESKLLFCISCKLLSIYLFIIALIIHILCTLEYLNYDLLGVFINILVAGVIILNLNGDSFFSKILNNKYLEKIGVLSYSLYIWQQLFTIKQAWWNIFPLEISICINLILLILISYISYNYIEKKFIELRKKLF